MKPDQPYYRCTDPDDPGAVWHMTRNRTDLTFWRAMTPADDADVDTVIAALSTRTGQSKGTTLTWTRIVDLLGDYPLLAAHNDALGLLDYPRLQAIEKGLMAVTDPAITAEIDRRVVAYLTPTRKNQHLPGAKAIGAMLRKIVAELDPAAAEQETSPDRESITFSSDGHGATTISVSVADDTAREIREILALLAAEKAARGEKRATLLDALLSLIRGKDYSPKVVFNVYGPAGGVPEYVSGGGWLDDRQAADWWDKVTQVRDMDQAIQESTEAYRPTTAIAAAVRGRDGTCRGPEGCDVDAADCQLDHVVNHAAGGQTTVENLQSLCPRHHNMKTGRRVQATMAPDGVVTWLFPDGSTVVTVPSGPLAKINQRFGQTFAQQRTKRIQRRREANRENPPQLWKDLNEPPF